MSGQELLKAVGDTLAILPLLSKVDEAFYEPLETAYTALLEENQKDATGQPRNVYWNRGFYDVTSFGDLFFKACTTPKSVISTAITKQF